jgi:hypothetical protein
MASSISAGVILLYDGVSEIVAGFEHRSTSLLREVAMPDVVAMGDLPSNPQFSHSVELFRRESYPSRFLLRTL